MTSGRTAGCRASTWWSALAAMRSSLSRGSSCSTGPGSGTCSTSSSSWTQTPTQDWPGGERCLRRRKSSDNYYRLWKSFPNLTKTFICSFQLDTENLLVFSELSDWKNRSWTKIQFRTNLEFSLIYRRVLRDLGERGRDLTQVNRRLQTSERCHCFIVHRFIFSRFCPSTPTWWSPHLMR